MILFIIHVLVNLWLRKPGLKARVNNLGLAKTSIVASVVVPRDPRRAIIKDIYVRDRLPAVFAHSGSVLRGGFSTVPRRRLGLFECEPVTIVPRRVFQYFFTLCLAGSFWIAIDLSTLLLVIHWK